MTYLCKDRESSHVADQQKGGFVNNNSNSCNNNSLRVQERHTCSDLHSRNRMRGAVLTRADKSRCGLNLSGVIG